MSDTENQHRSSQPPKLDYARSHRRKAQRRLPLAEIAFSLAMLVLLGQVFGLYWAQRASGAVVYIPVVTSLWIMALAATIGLAIAVLRGAGDVQLARTQALVSIGIAVLAAMLAGIQLSSTLSGRRENRQSFACERHFSDIRKAIDQYRLDSDGRWPQALTELVDLGLLEPRQIRCDSSRTPYVYLGEALPPDPTGAEVVLYEPPANHPGGGAFWGAMRIMLADGQVERFREPQASRELRRIEAALATQP